MVKLFLTSLLVFCALVLYSQNIKKDSTPPLKPIACDCKKAIKLTIGWNTKYGPTVNTKGYGSIQEIPVKEKFSKYYFETEHNSAWYLIKINTEGELVFDIVPTNPADDYDFLLFKYTDTGFCRNFLARKLIPLRTNISRVSGEDSSKTGLSSTAKVEYETRGKGYAYSKSIHVKKGDQYMLVLDNVYDSGKGHTINFHILKDFTFTGKTLGDDSLPISAHVSIMGNNGTVLAETTSDKKTGAYTLLTPLELSSNYTLSYYTHNTFFDIKTITTRQKTPDTIKYKPVVLQQLKQGATYKLKNILFYGDSSTVLPQSVPTLMALYAMMVIHNKMVIQIEGHVNPVGADHHYEQALSERRAQTVYNYLIGKGIAKERLSTMGFGGKHPLFSGIISEDQAQQNKRVEIRIISLGE